MADNKEAGLPFSPYLFTEWVSDIERKSQTMYTADQMHAFREAGFSELRAEVGRLKAELKRLQPHAARYKWLRDRHSGEFEKIILMSEWCSRSDWDNAIDAARSAASGESAGGV